MTRAVDISADTSQLTVIEGGVSDPDAALIIAMAAGDSGALSDLMDRHLKTIKSLAWHMLGDDMAAEDVAQEVLLKSWIMARTWEPGRAKLKSGFLVQTICTSLIISSAKVYKVCQSGGSQHRLKIWNIGLWRTPTVF